MINNIDYYGINEFLLPDFKIYMIKAYNLFYSGVSYGYAKGKKKNG